MRKAAGVIAALSMVFLTMGYCDVFAADSPHLRLGLVKFGSAAWEIDTMRHHGYDSAAGIAIDSVDLANPAAGEVALQAGGADAILTDWLWVSRQRAAGQRITFVPHFSTLGEIMVAADSPIRRVEDLAGKRLGIAGGPDDKSWQLLRAYGRHRLGYDPAERLQAVYAAPPLLSRELAGGRIDAVLTYWPFAARLAVQGFRKVAGMSDIMAELGFDKPVALLGYGVTDSWIAANPGGLQKFLAALNRADAEMTRSGGEWERLRPLTAAEDEATLEALRRRFCAGLVTDWGPGEEAAAARLFSLLIENGEPRQTGGGGQITAGTFWSEKGR
ncbi:MAG TPA: ABC transporter substrate-binding protein [Rhodospirillaceae bacterium]|nr:ABC transporter substrate-binding protein [Rhodospirillaceae bacterium]